MQIEIRDDYLEISGYVNAIERNSKILNSPTGKFKERIKKGCFKRAIESNPDIKLLFNHDWQSVLGSTVDGTLTLVEDNIGLRAKAKITDKNCMEKARNGNLVGWSFGFQDIEVTRKVEDNVPIREVINMKLFEVSILDNTKIPAYDGTLIESREEGIIQYRNCENDNEITVDEIISYRNFRERIQRMKEN